MHLQPLTFITRTFSSLFQLSTFHKRLNFNVTLLLAPFSNASITFFKYDSSAQLSLNLTDFIIPMQSKYRDA